jgi:hypothetical protein
MSESPEYFLGKVAAHAYADELRELLAGYEKLSGYGQAVPGVDPATLAKVKTPDPTALAKQVATAGKGTTQAVSNVGRELAARLASR